MLYGDLSPKSITIYLVIVKAGILNTDSGKVGTTQEGPRGIIVYGQVVPLQSLVTLQNVPKIFEEVRFVHELTVILNVDKINGRSLRVALVALAMVVGACHFWDYQQDQHSNCEEEENRRFRRFSFD